MLPPNPNPHSSPKWFGGSKVAHKVKVTAVKSNNLSLIPRLYGVEGENQLPEDGLDTLAVVPTHAHDWIQ